MGEINDNVLKSFERYIIMFGRKKIVSSNDMPSIIMIYNNIIGKNFAGDKKLHKKYLEFVSSQTGLDINLENCNKVKIINSAE